MLVYETEGFLEVTAKSIQQLCRSKVSVNFGEAEREIYAVHAALCNYQDNSEQRCRVAFYSKTLKGSLIFAVERSEEQSPWHCGREALAQLGFQLDDVDLKLSPAMLEVVLRDIPGLLSPVAARKERTEKLLMLAKLQESCDKDPDSAQGKQAALKLSAEVRLSGYAEELRLLLERSISTNAASHAEVKIYTDQMKELTARLDAAVALAETERRQREMSESITAAAEKRIQELEELLVDVETNASVVLKQKRKIAQLKGRIKKLDETQTAKEVESAKQGEELEQSIAAVNVAHVRIALLEEQLKNSESSVENIQIQLAGNQAEGTQLSENLKCAEHRITVLEAGVKDAEEKLEQHDKAAKVTADAQTQLVAAQQALHDALDLNSSLQEKLETANAQNEGLGESLRQTEKLASDKAAAQQQLIALTEQNEELAKELKDLRDGYDQECSLRRRLEQSSAEENLRILKLEEALASATENTSEMSRDEMTAATAARDIESLSLELRELKQQLKEEQSSRQDLDSEMLEAHKMIDSLEKMVRETESATAEQLSREGGESQTLSALEQKLKTVESQLEQERIEQKRLTRTLAVAEKKISEQEEKLEKRQTVPVESATQITVATTANHKPKKPLPHEVRPAPGKGSFFQPDWDLQGLPCQSSKQVVNAWETLFNVQTSLEGYPSQYCMAFLVVLSLEQKKSLYLLYRLKQSKHTLVCVPSKAPKDEASLDKVIKEGLDFLKKSGFGMEMMSTEDIERTLGTYFLGD